MVRVSLWLSNGVFLYLFNGRLSVNWLGSQKQSFGISLVTTVIYLWQCSRVKYTVGVTSQHEAPTTRPMKHLDAMIRLHERM
jgi:hypothetical protein